MTSALRTFATEIQGKLEAGVTEAREVLDQRLPGVLSIAAKYEASPIVQALESAVLPPEVEASIARLITDLAAKFPVAAPAATGEPDAQPPADVPAAP